MAHREGPFLQEKFDHRQHVKFAWTVLHERGPLEAQAAVSDEIRRFAAIRAPGKYHETLTAFWVTLVAHTVSINDEPDFDRHLAQFPILVDKRAPWRHYSEELLATSAAREAVVLPDRVPLP